MTVESSRGDIASIQFLRGVAAVMVVLVHIALQLGRLGTPTFEAGWLLAGVDIFFVISGFIMWVSTARNPERGALDFMRNRIIRIVPLYWTLTLGMVALLVIAPQIFQSARFDVVHTWKSLLFIAARHPTVDALWPVIVPGWTLNYEMFFYVLFSGAIALCGGSLGRRAALVASFLVAAVALWLLFPRWPAELRFYGDPIILEFLLGIAIGWVYWPNRPPISRWWWAATAIGFAALMFMRLPDAARVVTFGLPAALIVAGAAFAPSFACAPLRRLGDASYSIYLSHGLTLSAVTQGWGLLPREARHPAAVIGTELAAAIIVGFCTYRLIELPLTGLARQALVGRSAAVPAQA